MCVAALRLPSFSHRYTGQFIHFRRWFQMRCHQSSGLHTPQWKHKPEQQLPCRTELNSIVPLGVWKASGYALPACLREVGRVKTGWMNEGYCWFCSCFSYAAVIGFLTHTAVRVECHFIISTPQMQTRFQMPCGSGANNPVFICAQLNTDSILILIFLGRG